MPTHRITARPEPVEIDPDRSALIVVDMQNAFGSEGGMFDKAGFDITGIQRTVAPTAAAIEAARGADIKVVWIKMGFQPDLSDLGDEDSPNGRLCLALGVKDGVLTRNQWGTDIVDELTPAAAEPVVYKDPLQRLLPHRAGRATSQPRSEAPRHHRLHDEHLRRVNDPRRLLP